MINVGIIGRGYYRVLGSDSNEIIYNKVTNNNNNK